MKNGKKKGQPPAPGNPMPRKETGSAALSGKNTAPGKPISRKKEGTEAAPAVRKGERNGILICGAYGLGNAGDEAILTAILREVRSVAPEAAPASSKPSRNFAHVFSSQFLL